MKQGISTKTKTRLVEKQEPIDTQHTDNTSYITLHNTSQTKTTCGRINDDSSQKAYSNVR
jgi:hypothetical protein